MRGTCCLVALMILIAGLGCDDKPRRQLRRPDVQSWELPDANTMKDPPTYPDEKRSIGAQQQKGPATPGNLGGGAGGPGGVGGGAGGFGPGGIR